MISAVTMFRLVADAERILQGMDLCGINENDEGSEVYVC